MTDNLKIQEFAQLGGDLSIAIFPEVSVESAKDLVLPKGIRMNFICSTEMRDNKPGTMMVNHFIVTEERCMVPKRNTSLEDTTIGEKQASSIYIISPLKCIGLPLYAFDSAFVVFEHIVRKNMYDYFDLIDKYLAIMRQIEQKTKETPILHQISGKLVSSNQFEGYGLLTFFSSKESYMKMRDLVDNIEVKEKFMGTIYKFTRPVKRTVQ